MDEGATTTTPFEMTGPDRLAVMLVIGTEFHRSQSLDLNVYSPEPLGVSVVPPLPCFTRSNADAGRTPGCLPGTGGRSTNMRPPVSAAMAAVEHSAIRAEMKTL